MNPLTPIAVSKWMSCLCPCQARGPVVEKNTTLDVDAWIAKTRKNNASSPSKTEKPYAVLAPLSPCERTATKIKAWTGFATGTISSVGFRCSNDKPRNCISKQWWPRDPVAWKSFANFNRALGPQYQLLVMTRMKPFFLIFKGPTAPHQIRLSKSNVHFDGCTSFPAFVNRSYYCLDCERGFNTNDRTSHICQGRRCSACGRFDCQDYVRGTRPTDYCTLCHCKFYGGYCKRHHVVTKQCQSIKTCLKCQAQYTVVPNLRHKCGHAKCPVCQEWVSIQDHKCYIEPVVEEEETEPTEEGGGCIVAPPPPLFVYSDFEAMQNAEGVFVANLLCYSSTEEETIHVLEGEDCALQFLDLDDLVDVPDSDGDREILVVFHNLKGFDGMFILHELYQQQQEVVDQLTVGAKVLSFKSGRLIQQKWR